MIKSIRTIRNQSALTFTVGEEDPCAATSGLSRGTVSSIVKVDKTYDVNFGPHRHILLPAAMYC